MENLLKVERVIKNGNLLSFDYKFNGKWKDCLMEESLTIEYDVDITDVPDSVLYVPLLCNILPISWIFDLNIEINELDKNFADSIEDIKKGYQEMYPNILMQGNLTIKKLIENSYLTTSSGTLFSGGVDAFNTLFNHLEEKPMLITVWGADIKLDNVDGWKEVSNHTIMCANQFGLEYTFIKSNFRMHINYENLSAYVGKFVNDEWWHGFQHGIGILGHTAPIAYLNKFKVIYIASSFTAEYKGKYTCASDPIIDNNLKFTSCNVSHDGYEFNRQDKIRNICNFLEDKKIDNIMLRVCWQDDTGENCCECEKCTRTILGIIAEKKDPSRFGFNLTNQKWHKIIKKIKKIAKYNFRYLCIQKRLIDNYTPEETPKELLQFRTLKIKYNKPIYINFFIKLKKITKKLLRR